MSISKRTRTFLALIAPAFVAVGCQPPPVIEAVPPGQNLRESLMPKEDVAVAQGETGPPAKEEASATIPDLVPAPPTGKGEVKTTPAGVQYETVKEGTGATVKAGQKVTVHYVGTLDNGKKFDSSRDRGEPATFEIGTRKVIKGWDEAVPGMKVGEIRKLTIPPSAGYGALGSGENVPPNATLHFEIEMIKAE